MSDITTHELREFLRQFRADAAKAHDTPYNTGFLDGAGIISNDILRLLVIPHERRNGQQRRAERWTVQDGGREVIFSSEKLAEEYARDTAQAKPRHYVEVLPSDGWTSCSGGYNLP